MCRQRGFTLLEHVAVVAIALAATALVLTGHSKQREHRAQDELVLGAMDVFNHLATGVEGYVAANGASWTAGSMMTISIADLVAGNHIPADLLPVSPYSPFGGEILIRARKDTTDGSVIRVVISDSGRQALLENVDRSPLLLKTGLLGDAVTQDREVTYVALMSDLGRKINNLREKVMGVVPDCNSGTGHSIQPNLTLDLSDWVEGSNCERPRPIALVGWPELGQGTVDCEVDTCVTVDFELPDVDECYFQHRFFQYGNIGPSVTQGPWVYSGSDQCISGYEQVSNFPVCGVQITPARDAGTALTQGKYDQWAYANFIGSMDPNRIFVQGCSNYASCFNRRNTRTYGQVSVNNSIVSTVLCEAREYVTDSPSLSAYLKRGYASGNASLCCR